MMYGGRDMMSVMTSDQPGTVFVRMVNENCDRETQSALKRCELQEQLALMGKVVVTIRVH